MKASSTARTVTFVLLAVWAVFAIFFVLKLRNAFDHPLEKPNPGGLLFLISQAALGAALVLMFQRSNDGDSS